MMARRMRNAMTSAKRLAISCWMGIPSLHYYEHKQSVRVPSTMTYVTVGQIWKNGTMNNVPQQLPQRFLKFTPHPQAPSEPLRSKNIYKTLI